MKINELLNERGFSVLEVILAAAIFVTFATAAVVVVISGIDNNRLGGEMTVANQFNAEGMEAVRSIKNQSWTTFAGKADTGDTGVTNGSGTWVFNGTSDTLASDNRFSRKISITSAQRDGSRNIVASGGTNDPHTKKVTVTTSWNFTNARPESVVLTSYLTSWTAQASMLRGGMLVYGNGATTGDAIMYQAYNVGADTWTTPASAADIDVSTNRALRAVRLFSSPTRNEKVMISRHYATSTTTQYIYAQVYNGSAWGNVRLLSSWTSSSYLDVRNFDGVYLANGDFMVVYSDNTRIPKFAIWNGTSWVNVGTALRTLPSAVPIYIVLRARPGTNEAMAAFLGGTTRNTNTQYFNNFSGYATASWVLHSQHASTNPVAGVEMVDFNWLANNPLKGALIYSSGTSDTSIETKIYNVSSSTWTAQVSASAQTGRMRAMNLDTRKGADEYIACAKDASYDIDCFESNGTPQWATPTNNAITTQTDTTNERSYDIVYESLSGNRAIIVYSDNTSTVKFKRYDPIVTPNIFESSSTSVGVLSAAAKGIRLIPQSDGDDIMALMFDNNRRVYTAAWNNSIDAFYTSGGRAFLPHGTNGSAATEFWASFAWDNY